MHSQRSASHRPQPPPKKAWLAVQGYKNTATVVTIDVKIKKEGEADFKLLGKLLGLRGPGHFRWPFFRDRSRLPSYGGFPLEPGVGFSLELEGKDKDDKPVAETKVSRGPYLPAEGAIIDVEETF